MKNLINKCANWANEAYENKVENKELIEDKETDVQLYVSEEGEYKIIAFRGSTSLKDWTIDFQITRDSVDYLNNTKVHKGFLKQYNAVRNKIKEFIKDGTKIITTGHSLGGALATICALDIAINNESEECLVACVTFGSPRCGDSEFCKLFKRYVDISHRVVYEKDPVTFMPLPIRFKHVTGGLQLKRQKLCKKCDECYITEDEFSKYNCLGCKIKHHSMNLYVLGTNRLS